jgi:hypothetical protein
MMEGSGMLVERLAWEGKSVPVSFFDTNSIFTALRLIVGLCCEKPLPNATARPLADLKLIILSNIFDIFTK